MDNSWSIEFAGLKILIDPWLIGEEIDFFSWFNTQWHKTKPVSPAAVGSFDLILITQKYPDHFHKETLKLLNPPHIICPASIKASIQTLLPNCEVQSFNKGIQKVLNTELNIHFLPTSRKIDPIYDALILENEKQSIFVATHGFTAHEKWKAKISSLPPIHLLLSPFDHYQLPFFLGGTVAPGIEGLKQLVKNINPQYVIATHDEDKHAKGLVQAFAKITKPPSIEKLNQDPVLQDKIRNINNYETLEL
jgi:L-ascorbate metabolism protein UlaG (beta-lactamase superfamily)